MAKGISKHIGNPGQWTFVPDCPGLIAVARIGIIVDGQSEYRSLPALLAQIGLASGNQFIGPLVTMMSPTTPMAVFARDCEPNIAILARKNVHRIIVLFDMEHRPMCPGALARRAQTELQRRTDLPVSVVIKVQMFENWVLADLQAVKSLQMRFRPSRSCENMIVPNKADNVNALQLLNSCAQGGEYRKIRDSQQILERSDIHRIADHSRSFRRFLRIAGHPGYARQSRLP